MAAPCRLCDVVVPRTRLDELTYDCSGLESPVAPGDCVEVRLRGRRVKGIVVGTPEATRVRGLQPVERLVEAALVPRDLLALADWLAGYYCCPRGEAFTALLPSAICGYRPRVRGDEPGPNGPAPAADWPGGITDGFGVWLSTARAGRLELVADFLAAARARGGGILLVPEGELGRWLPELALRFGPDLVEYHSRAGVMAQKRAWRGVHAGSHRLVVGVRSAVFAPLPSLGGIAVVDAHDPVYKEQRYPRFHARDVAAVRARESGCPLLLADPLPAVETWHNVTRGSYSLLDGSARPERYPASFVADMRRHRGLFSPRLEHALAALPGDSSALFYVNRKGLSRHVTCADCGAALECPDCRLPMALDAGGRLTCAWCGTSRPAPETCPGCGGASFNLQSAGLEMVARELTRLAPGREVVRVEAGKTPPVPPGALVAGTRALLALDWPARTGLVAVVNFDFELSLPDFRVRERAFTTLAGLVERARERGAALIVQTRRPDEAALDAGLSHDVAGFLAAELELRREAGLPPWRRLAVVDIGGGNRGALLNHARAMTQALAGRRGVEVIGPADARLGRVRLLVRFPRARSLGTLLDRALLRQGHLDIRVDVDPDDTV